MRMLSRLLFAHAIAAILLTSSYAHLQSKPTDIAHEYMHRMYGGKFPTIPLVPYIGEITQALALRCKDTNLARTLYSITLASQAVDGASAFTTAISDPPSTGDTELDELQAPTTLSRLVHGSFGLLQLSNLPASARLIANADSLTKLYKRHPKLCKSLKRICNKRITNATISLMIYLGARLVVSWLNTRVKSKNRTDDEATHMALSMAVSSILSALLLDTQSEEVGIEEQLIAHAQRLEQQQQQKKNRSFFAPPANTIRTQRTKQHSPRLKADEVRIGLPVNDGFEEISLEGLPENE